MLPAEVYKRDGWVWCGLFQFAVRPKRMSYYVPVTVLFYYNTHEGRWRVSELAAHAHIAPSIPLF